MLKSKKIIAIVLMMFLIVSICTQVRADDEPIDLPIISGDPNEILANEIAANEIAANQEAANQVVQPDTNEDASSYTNSNTLPQTGVTEDITISFFIVVCVVIAIYAYKKIRDYNI